ncbi:MAG: lipid-A-disaccharide synthase [Candidatus Eisenbacteria bacterium]
MASAFLLAGESSGDLQGALLARQLRALRPDLELYGVGGERMEEAGVELLFRSDELAVVGVTEVLGILPKILGAMERIREFLSARRPDVFIPIDFPDFNLRLLPHAWRIGVPIVYYIGPQVWAWRQERLDYMRRYVALVIVIFPFEESLYRERGIPVEFVGHPLVGEVPEDLSAARAAERERLGFRPDETVVALLPGSRRSELHRVGPVLREARSALSDLDCRWVVGQARGLSLVAREELGCPVTTPVTDGFTALLAADMAWVASGTATLEALLLTTPSIVVYRVKRSTYEIARRVVKVPHIAMANLIAGHRLLPELIQDEADPRALAALTREWVASPETRAEIEQGLADARHSLGEPGAAGRAADLILERIG